MMWQRAKNILPPLVFVSGAVVTCEYCICPRCTATTASTMPPSISFPSCRHCCNALIGNHHNNKHSIITSRIRKKVRDDVDASNLNGVCGRKYYKQQHNIHTSADILIRKHHIYNNKDYFWNFKPWIDIWTKFWLIVPVGRPIITMAEAAAVTSNSIRPSEQKKKRGNKNKNKKENKNNVSEDCPFYGCQLLPLDILVAKQKLQKGKPSSRQKYYNDAILEYDTVAKQLFALRYLNNEKNQDRSSRYRNSKNEEAKIKKVMNSLSSMYSESPNKMATMSMIGYKGGSIREQINQDRSFAIGPFYVKNTTTNDDSNIAFEDDSILLGVFDGHARLGERVSEYVVKAFPRLLSVKLGKALANKHYYNQEGQTQEEQTQIEKDIVNIVREVMIDTFVELDKTAPAEFSGGCTASVVFKFRNKIYIANTGDSLSFIGIHRKKSNKTKIIYTSREDKPHLFDERRRIEEMGGEVFIPPPNRGGTSRVVYTDPITNSRSGLAMSRSIGDWDFSDLGVIPDPTVDVLDIDQIIKSQLIESDDNSEVDCFVFDEHGMVRPADVDKSSSDNSVKNLCQKELEQIKKSGNNNLDSDDDDIHIFAISATDGMMDYATPDDIASIISHSLYNTNVGEKREEEPQQQRSTFSVWRSSSSKSNKENKQEKDKNAMHLLTACEMLINNAADGWNRSKAGRYRDDIAISVSSIRSPSNGKSNQNSQASSFTNKSSKKKGGSVKNEL